MPICCGRCESCECCDLPMCLHGDDQGGVVAAPVVVQPVVAASAVSVTHEQMTLWADTKES